MPFRIKATLKGGKVLEVEYGDCETAEAELRCFERWRKARWGFPCMSWRTVDDGVWVVCPYRDFEGDPEIYEVALPQAMAAAG